MWRTFRLRCATRMFGWRGDGGFGGGVDSERVLGCFDMVGKFRTLVLKILDCLRSCEAEHCMRTELCERARQ